MGSHEIDVKETIEDKETWFNIKRFKIGDVSFNKPEKSLDLKPIDRHVYDFITKESDFKFSEVSKSIHSFQYIDRLYKETDNVAINDFFWKRNWLSGSPFVLNFTLGFNPMLHMKEKKAFESFLDYYYSFSNFFLTVPNLRTNRVIKKPHLPRRQITVTSIRDYIRSVDFFYEALNMKNKKPIFVPISIRMSGSEVDMLLDHYIGKEYYYYWVDFEGRAINDVKLGSLRHIFRMIKQRGYFGKTVTYFTNVKREILSNVKSDNSPASDALSSLAGANLIGCDREPARVIEGEAEPIPPEHKARIFQKETYYYVKTKDRRLYQPRMYVTRNAVELNNEFANQAEFFTENGELNHLLSRKNMLVRFRNGSILRELMAKKEEEGTPELGKYF